jgi:hypothetical protein
MGTDRLLENCAASWASEKYQVAGIRAQPLLLLVTSAWLKIRVYSRSSAVKKRFGSLVELISAYKWSSVVQKNPFLTYPGNLFRPRHFQCDPAASNSCSDSTICWASISGRTTRAAITPSSNTEMRRASFTARCAEIPGFWESALARISTSVT